MIQHLATFVTDKPFGWSLSSALELHVVNSSDYPELVC